MKMYYVANARMPNEKAHGIQIAKMCEAFIEAGVDLTLVVPKRWSPPSDMQTFYALRTPVPLVQLWIPRLYQFGKFGFFFSSLYFMVRYSFFLVGRRVRGERFLIYTVDMDSFSSTLLPLFGPCVIEMHSPKNTTIASRFFFRNAIGVIATNPLIQEALIQTFALLPKRVVAEPNGVDGAFSEQKLSKEEARHTLSLPAGLKLALYVGRMYEWKGLEVVSATAERLAEKNITLGIVGATREEFERVTKRSGERIVFYGGHPSAEIPTWLAAADALFVVGTKRDEASYRYTAPMKIFEYLAARRPVVATRTPALESLIADEVVWCDPDDAEDLARALAQAIERPDFARLTRASSLAQNHAWGARAQRIMHFIEHHD